MPFKDLWHSFIRIQNGKTLYSRSNGSRDIDFQRLSLAQTWNEPKPINLGRCRGTHILHSCLLYWHFNTQYSKHGGNQLQMSRTFVQVKHMRSKFELFWDTVGLPIYYILVYYSSTAICIIQDMGEIKKKAVRQVRLVVNGQLVGQVRLGQVTRSAHHRGWSSK